MIQIPETLFVTMEQDNSCQPISPVSADKDVKIPVMS